MVTFGLLLVLSLNAGTTWSVERGEDCPHDGVWISSSQKCLMILQTTEETGFRSAFEARQKCWSIGGEIASIDLNSNDAATQLLSTHGRSAYIGLNDAEVEGNWTWFDGTMLDPRLELPWDRGEPNSGGSIKMKDGEDCVVAKASNHLHDYPCCLPSRIRAVLCQTTDMQQAGNTSSLEKEERLPDDNDPLALQCISEVDECQVQNVTCSNGGSCVDKLGRYECLCPNGYTGKQCESAICQKPPDFNNSTRDGGNVAEGSIVRYTCDFGYRFPDKFGGQQFIEMICSEHNWTFVTQPNVKFNQSDINLNQSDVNLNQSDVNLNQSDVNLNQSDVKFNQSDFKFNLSLDLLYCEPICQKPPDLENSTHGEETVVEGSIVRYTCDYGHRFPDKFGGQQFIEMICSEHNWKFVNQSDVKFNQSDVKFNQSDVEFNQSDVTFNQSDCEFNQSDVTFNQPDVKFNQSDVEFNQSDVKFIQSDELAYCEPVFCTCVPTWIGIIPESKKINRAEAGDVVTYKCREGKQFDDKNPEGESVNQTTTCQLNGTWFPPFRKCTHVDTGQQQKIEPVEAPGAAAIGTVAIIFISIEVALIVLMDVDHLVRHARMFKDNVAVGVGRLTGFC